MFIFKRAIKKNTPSEEAQELLARLNSFLDENSPQLTYWLTKIFKEQQNSVTYAELERAAAAGFENEIRKWQEDYARFVNEKLNPLWRSAINEGAKHFSEKHGNVFYDSDRFVKDWLNKHGAEFVTNINAETRQAIKSILAYGQDNGMSMKEIAKMIRPTIGLNQRQAAANLRYQNKVRENLLKNHPRMTQAKAEEKAQAAALKYSSKQHRQRAEMIAHTELSFAYNRGTHESVRQAMSNGLMGRCEKVWTTAGTNRVCGRCMDLSGTVVGFEDKFFNSSVTDGQTPPLHPRCRCVIVYREIDEPKRNSRSDYLEIKGFAATVIKPNNSDELNGLLEKYVTPDYFLVNRVMNKPIACDMAEGKILYNPQYPYWYKYDTVEAVTHEISHLIDLENEISLSLSNEIFEIADKVNKILLSNRKHYKNLLSGSLGENMSVSDLVAAITYTELSGIFAHEKDYWTKSPGNREREIVANLMTIHYTNDKIGLEFVNSIIPLKELLKELKKCYGTEVTKRRD